MNFLRKDSLLPRRYNALSWINLAVICLVTIWAVTVRNSLNFEISFCYIWLCITLSAALYRKYSIVLLCHLAAISFPLEYPMVGSVSVYRIVLFLTLIILIANHAVQIITVYRVLLVYLTMFGVLFYSYSFFTQEENIGVYVIQQSHNYMMWIVYFLLGALCYKQEENYPFYSMLWIGITVTSLNILFPSEELRVTEKNIYDVRRMFMATDPNYASFVFFQV